MVVRLFLVQFVLVRIQVGQPKKEEAATQVAVFFMYEGAVSETSSKWSRGKAELARDLTILSFEKIAKQLATEHIKLAELV